MCAVHCLEAPPIRCYAHHTLLLIFASLCCCLHMLACLRNASLLLSCCCGVIETRAQCKAKRRENEREIVMSTTAIGWGFKTVNGAHGALILTAIGSELEGKDLDRAINFGSLQHPQGACKFQPSSQWQRNKFWKGLPS